MKQLIYFADPMCSWCWGFSPIIGRILGDYKDRLQLHMIMGGLRAGNTQIMDEEQKSYIRGHWQHVAERSGQPFNWSLFDREDFVYNTEPACRAVVTARNMAQDQAYPMMHAVQSAFYAEGRDVTAVDVLCEVASIIGLHEGTFREAFLSDTAATMTARDFATSRQVGVRGFPTLLLGDDGVQLDIITNGYQDYDAITSRLDLALGELEASAEV